MGYFDVQSISQIFANDLRNQWAVVVQRYEREPISWTGKLTERYSHGGC